MRPLLFSAFFFLFFATLHAQAPAAGECAKFHTGTFYAKGMPQVIIERDSLYQVERDPKTGLYVKMSVTWTSDCTYQLRLVKTNDRSHKKTWKKVKVLTITITQVDEDSYHFSAMSPAFTEPVTGVIVRKSS